MKTTPTSSSLPGMETTAEERAEYRQWLNAPSPHEAHTLAGQKALWLLNDLDRALAEIARLTAALAAANADKRDSQRLMDWAREEERKACAKIADDVAAQEEKYAKDHPGDVKLHALRLAVWHTAKTRIAAAIRARGQS